jgi:hypothetical protein
MAHDVRALFVMAQHAMSMTQQQFGDAIGSSRRAVQRWTVSGPPSYAVPRIVRALHPHDASLAAELAAAHGKTLAEMGVPPPAQAHVTPSSSPAPCDAAVDAVVCACSEAVQMMPADVRPGLLAGFERAIEIGVSLEQAVRVLRARVVRTRR